MTKLRNLASKPRGKLPPVTVTCTSLGCGHRWLSGAARHSVVRCPECGHGTRVKRVPAASRPGTAASHTRPVTQGAENAEPVCEQGAPVLSPAGSPPPIGALAVEVDDEGWTWNYLTTAEGNAALADWTDDGCGNDILVPVTLIDQRFRLLHAGACSVYGCREEARWMWDGWPVCTECRVWLGPEPRPVRH